MSMQTHNNKLLMTTYNSCKIELNNIINLKKMCPVLIYKNSVIASSALYIFF